MTAAPPVKILTAAAEKRALLCALGEMDIQAAVDGLQYYAERSGLVAELGQDRSQDIIAAAFIWAREVADAGGIDDTIEPALSEYESNYVARIISQWEAEDVARPRAVAKAADRYRTPQSVVDAFWCAMQSGDANYLSRWLSDHPLDASHLKKFWEAKCLTAAA